MSRLNFRIYVNSNDSNPSGKMYYPEDEVEKEVGNHNIPGLFLLNLFGDLLLTRNKLLDPVSFCYARVSNSGIHIMQYTGMKDKNGRKIYEGDICFWENKNRVWIYDDGCFGFKGTISECVHMSSFNAKQMEIIGNIYENPDLIDVDTNEN